MTNNDIKRIRELLEFLVKEKINKKVKKLNSDEKKVYDLASDSVRTIKEKTQFSLGKISGTLQKLEIESVLEKKGKEYRRII